MRFYLLITLIFSVKIVFAALCFDKGTPGWMVGNTCQKQETAQACPEKNSHSCDYTLFGANLCVSNNENSIIKSCAKKSFEQNFKRFHQMPSYYYLTFKNRIKEIEKLCTEESDKIQKASNCHELLIAARELNGYFNDHFKIIKEEQDVYGPRCESDSSFYPSSIFYFHQFLPQTVFIDHPYKFKIPKIIHPNLRTNKRGDYCIRSKDLIDTIVLHHTETSNTDSLETINNYHISRGWYQIGYHYIIQTNYEGDPTSRDILYQTRNPLLTGAHAGSYSYEEKKPTKSELKNISCYRVNGSPKEKESPVNDRGFIKANSTTIGIAIMGNFSPVGPLNPNGRPRNPFGFAKGEVRTLNSHTSRQVAELMCHLQEKYPNLKKLKKHNDYKQTSCPGTIADSMTEIIRITKEIGCDFSL